MTLAECFEINGLSGYLTEEKAEKLEFLSRYLIEYNKRINITALTEPSDIYAKHIADSAALLPLLSGAGALLDVGCGGGFPSLPVAILNEKINVTSMDSTEKKLGFIVEIKEKLNLNNISVLPGRAEELCKNGLRQSFDAVTARAVASLPVLCELCLPYVKRGGIFAAMKTDLSELDNAENAARILGAKSAENVSYKLKYGGGEADRCIIVYKKIKNTDMKYPRRYSQIKAKPL